MRFNLTEGFERSSPRLLISVGKILVVESLCENKKTLTEAVRAANQANAEKSTGPRTDRGKENSRPNAVRHGLLSKNLFLKTDEEKLEFRDLLLAFLNEFHADGFVEEVLVEEIASCFWKMQIALGLETRELSSRKNLRDRFKRCL